VILLSTTAIPGSAATYFGNGNSGFGGPIGLGSLTLTDDGTTVFGTVNKGPNGFADVLVIYIDSQAGGFSDTSGFGDGADGLRKAISGFDGSANRSLLTFGFGGFLPDYAIALGPASDNFGGLWQLTNGGNNSLNFLASVNLNPTGINNSTNYTFSFNVSQIGITPNTGATFELFGTYTSDTGFRSDEAVAGNDSGTQGWNPFLMTAFSTYTIAADPTIITQPQSQSVNPGSNATLCVTASGHSPLSYQWRFNGTNISGATSTCYTHINAQLADAGDYVVVVTNSSGSVTSAVATLSVTPLRLGWSTMDGGGGTSTGAVFAVRGTIGQLDAGRLTNGQSVINGGFWGVLAVVQTSGAPVLTIARTATNTALISWPFPSAGFSLQQNSNLATTNWVSPSEAISDNGVNKFIIVNPPTGNRFYRLFKP
jgi:hypothetical protein